VNILLKGTAYESDSNHPLKTHKYSRWVIAEYPGTFTTLVYDSGWVTSLESISLTLPDGHYQAKVQYIDGLELEGDFSDPIQLVFDPDATYGGGEDSAIDTPYSSDCIES
jgi:hypothetical protein